MGRAKKAEPVKDVKELNWEETEENSEFGNQNSELSAEENSEFGNQNSELSGQGPDAVIADPLMDEILAVSKIDVGCMVGYLIRQALARIDPEIRKDNPVWHWSLCDDHCTFVFRDGRKAVINF